MAVRMDMAMVLAVVGDHPESTPVMNDCRRCLDETMPESAKSVTVGVMSLDCCFPLPLWEEEQGEGEHNEEVTMKIEQTTMLDYDEVDTDFQMKLPVLFQRFQRAAVHHSEQVGLGSVAMVAGTAMMVSS